jgi:hypothetical protein
VDVGADQVYWVLICREEHAGGLGHAAFGLVALVLLEQDADLLGLLAEGHTRVPRGDDDEHGESRCGDGGQLGREDKRHDGSLGR